KSSTIAAQRSGGKEIDDLLNGFVGAMVGGFELAGRLVMGVRAVVKAAVGKRAAEPFVKEQEEQGDVNPFWGETVGVAGSVTLQQPVGFELAQVVAELVQPVGAVGEGEGGEDGVVDVLGGPAADLTTAVQDDLERARASLSTSRKPIPRSRSVGRAATASRDRRSFTRMRCVS